MSESKNILLVHCVTVISFSALQRIKSIAYYLAEQGHNVHVLQLQQDEQIDYGKHKNITVYSVADDSFFTRANCDRPSLYLWHKTKALYNIILPNIIPNLNRGWTKNAIHKADDIIRNNNIDCMITTFGPIAPHYVGLEMKEKHPKIQWIADMRDEISTAPHLLKMGRIHAQRIERQIVNKADAVTAVSKPILEDLKRFNTNPNVIFDEIRNGYNYTPAERTVNKKGSLCHLYYLGSFYGAINPSNFISALGNIIDKTPHLHVEFIGSNRNFFIPERLSKHIVTRDAVPYKEATRLMQQADLLLLILPTIQRKGVYSGKIFEYLASGTPIIGLVPKDDVAAALINQAGAGYLADNSNIKAIEECLLKAYSDWKNSALPTADPNVVRNHHRKEQVKRFARLIEKKAA